MGEKGRTFVENNFSWNIIVKKFIKIMSSNVNN